MSTIENWGDYFWPDALDECRVNLADIHDAEKLSAFEKYRTFDRHLELAVGAVEIPQTFDLGHLRAIHRHLFQDIYPWAGELRVTEMQRPGGAAGADHAFVPPQDIERLADLVMNQVGHPEEWRDLPRREQVQRLASTYAAVNMLHPFHDGNGRTQRVFLADVARAAGLQIDWTKMVDQNHVMAQTYEVGNAPLIEALAPCVRDLEHVAPVLTAADAAQPGHQLEVGTWSTAEVVDDLDAELAADYPELAAQVARTRAAAFPQPAQAATGVTSSAAMDGDESTHPTTRTAMPAQRDVHLEVAR